MLQCAATELPVLAPEPTVRTGTGCVWLCGARWSARLLVTGPGGRRMEAAGLVAGAEAEQPAVVLRLWPCIRP